MHVPAPPQPEPDRSHEEGDLSGVLRAAAGGDQAAWRVVIDRYSRRVYAMARSRVKSPELAEEVTQSVFVTVAAKLSSGGYAEQGRFESWLFRVVMNRVRDEARRVSRHATPTDPGQMPATAAERRGDDAGGERPDERVVKALRAALEQLPDQDREVVELRHHGQMSFKAMADLLGEPLGTLLARHHRALRKLQALLGGPVGTEWGLPAAPIGAPRAPAVGALDGHDGRGPGGRVGGPTGGVLKGGRRGER